MEVMFTGHRQLQNPNAIREATEREVIRLINQGAGTFYNGMALGYDLLTAKLILDLKATYTHIKLIAVLPCSPEAQTLKWRAEHKENYRNILSKSDETVTLSQKYFSGCMQARNLYMVEHSTYCICYLTQVTGGTAGTVRMAQKKGSTIINIAEKV